MTPKLSLQPFSFTYTQHSEIVNSTFCMILADLSNDSSLVSYDHISEAK